MITATITGYHAALKTADGIALHRANTFSCAVGYTDHLLVGKCKLLEGTVFVEHESNVDI